MPRLRTMPPRLSPAPDKIGKAPVTAGSGFSRTDGRSSTQRGYDAAWRRLRLQVLAAEPLCRKCSQAGRVTAATQVHHVKAFAGIDDPLRLDPDNCEPICEPCHVRESAHQSNGTTPKPAIGVDGWPLTAR